MGASKRVQRVAALRESNDARDTANRRRRDGASAADVQPLRDTEHRAWSKYRELS